MRRLLIKAFFSFQTIRMLISDLKSSVDATIDASHLLSLSLGLGSLALAELEGFCGWKVLVVDGWQVVVGDLSWRQVVVGDISSWCWCWNIDNKGLGNDAIFVVGSVDAAEWT
jgi:hypothetical protein